MMLCPHCETPADETVATNCPVCFLPLKINPSAAAVDYTPQAPGLTEPKAKASAPLPEPVSAAPIQPIQQTPPQMPTAPTAPDPTPEAAPQAPVAAPTPAAAPSYSSIPPTAPLGGLAYGSVMSLTGEIIQKPAIPTPVPGGAPRPGYNPAGARPIPGSTRMHSPARSGGIGAVVTTLLVFLMLGGAGFGGWYWWTHRSDPKQAVQLYLTAAADEDYPTIYKLTDLSEKDLIKYPDAQAFEKNAKKQQKKIIAGFNAMTGGMGGSFIDKGVQSFKDMLKQAKVGDANVDGDTATVPVTMHFSLMGIDKDINQDVLLKNVNGAWKVEKSAAPGMQSALSSR